MTDAIATFFLFWLGAGVGSFVSLKVLRSINQSTKGGSHCDKCRHKLAWSDLVPVLSYVVLGGKCRYCRQSISPTYGLFEILMGCLFALSYLYLPLSFIELAVWLAVATLLMSLFLTDLYCRKLPFIQILILTILCSIFVVLTGVFSEQKMCTSVMIEHIFSLIPLTGLFGTVFLLTRGRLIGGGDVLLGLPIAILLEWRWAIVALLLASVLALIFYLPLFFAKKIKSNTKIPFGSFLAIAALTSFFVMKLFVDFF
ncbi:MAG: prepilin peptidase [Candidatus Nomurabacteria bacterium]|jgi:prepilin signal peptidase PulO-like enzyme (type II secretory pathway)|nr:prepilin peptidase [Candidatus Nomurabacteria bacterium]